MSNPKSNSLIKPHIPTKEELQDLKDGELWESGQLGMDERYVKVCDDPEVEKLLEKLFPKKS